MRRNVFILIACLLGQAAPGAGENWIRWLAPELRQVEDSQRAAHAELKQLGVPVIGQTAIEIGYQRERIRTPPLTPDWIQVDLGKAQPIDYIALVPSVIDWQTADPPSYGFPLRFQVAISDDARFEKFTPIKNFNDEDFPQPGVAPVTVAAGGRKARFVRISVSKMPMIDGQYFFSLSEVMVLSGNLDIAIGRPVRASASVETPPRFSRHYLVDGRTHLGPPIRRDLLPWDGLHAGETSNATPPFMAVDLGEIYPLQQIRLLPMHARLGSDVPGFRFPQSFLVETSDSAQFKNPTVVMNAQGFSNPGDNPVTIPVNDVPARFVRMVARYPEGPGGPRFSLSELQAYSGGSNVALGATVTRTPDRFPSSKLWPTSILVDGYTSYGKLMELPEWLKGWERRRILQGELKTLDARQLALMTLARERATWMTTGLAALGVACAIGFWIITNFRIKRKLYAIQAGLARDIHDHIGSNLAGIAVLSEVARENSSANRTESDDWIEVNHIARETIEVMKEVIWLVGDKKGAQLDLMAQMHLAASRMLAGKTFSWNSIALTAPAAIPVKIHRDIFLFFKEALTNVVRHSQAKNIQLSSEVLAGRFQLSVVDDGCGFDPKTVRRGVGLDSQRLRAQAMGGSMNIVSSPGAGTAVYLTIPLGRMRKHLRFFNRWRHA